MYQQMIQLASDAGLTWPRLLWGVLLFAVSFVGSLALVIAVLVKLPPTYFQENHHPRMFAWADRHPVLRWLALFAKNLLGLALIVVGVLLSLPGVPGQGLLTIFIGILLTNYPGKRRLERWFVSQPKLRNAIDRLRARFGRPPLVLDDPPTPDRLTNSRVRHAEPAPPAASRR